MRLIDADRLLQLVEAMEEKTIGHTTFKEQVLLNIRGQPEITDLMPRRFARWMRKDYREHGIQLISAECSNCGWSLPLEEALPTSWKLDFCPHCASVMYGSDPDTFTRKPTGEKPKTIRL